VAEANQQAEETVAAAEKRLVELRAERETIAEYVESLRSVVGDVDAVTKKSKKADS